MSYCVNCGVELESGAKKCPLCSTEVVNPKCPPVEESNDAFSHREHIPTAIKTKFVAGIVSLVMLIPNIVCVLANAVFFHRSFWSFYVLATSFFMWIVFVVPFFMEKHRIYWMWAFDTCAAGLYVYILMSLLGFGGYYNSCALPIILLNSVLVLIYILWVRKKKRHVLLRALLICSDIAVSLFVCCLLLAVEASLKYATEIGIIIFVCIMAVVVFLAVCYSSKTIRKWLSKRLFVN
ncbi:MAG: hypothetical protein ACI4GB_00870 [Acutalibacteraceae bacterium]